ncbi:hypothetical protein AAC03nite_34040 [Alicyclobacillus acidoterrestris]|nr:hypothetical protein AAC03nite_34040 [Alicyclobacillus acidoterrestris]
MKIGKLSVFLVISLLILSVTVGTVSKVWASIPLWLDLKGGISVLYQIEPPKGQTLTKQGIQAALQAVETRVNSLGVTSPIIKSGERKRNSCATCRCL